MQASHDLDMPYKARQDISLKKEKDLSNHPMRIYTTQKMKFSINDFFSKCDQIRMKLRIWSHLLKKSLMGNFIFCAVIVLEKIIFVRMILRIFYLNFFAIENKDNWIAYISRLNLLSKCHVTAQSEKYCSGECTNILFWHKKFKV